MSKDKRLRHVLPSTKGPAVKITIVDYGAGNLPSGVSARLQQLGAETERAVRSGPARFGARPSCCRASAIFAAFVAGLRERNLTLSLQKAFDSGTPIRGICLGLQALYTSSQEAPGDAGLAFLAGEVRALPANVKSPHIGWNQVQRTQDQQTS